MIFRQPLKWIGALCACFCATLATSEETPPFVTATELPGTPQPVTLAEAIEYIEPEFVPSETSVAPVLPPVPTETQPIIPYDGELIEIEPVELGIFDYNQFGWYTLPEAGGTTWRNGSRGRFGTFSLEWTGATKFKSWEGLSSTHGHGFHFLDGPSISDMPPRLFDFHWGLHWFGNVADNATLDMAISAGIFTDFEDSAREGWRFPAHAVLTWEIDSAIEPVTGLKFFDRENLGLLPVLGFIARPDDGLRLEVVFPEPRVAWRVSATTESEQWMSVSGRIGGGEWAIERIGTGLADLVTYNDYQIVLGLETVKSREAISSLELGYVFSREMEYRSGAGNFDPSETIFVRLSHRK